MNARYLNDSYVFVTYIRNKGTRAISILNSILNYLFLMDEYNEKTIFIIFSNAFFSWLRR